MVAGVLLILLRPGPLSIAPDNNQLPFYLFLAHPYHFQCQVVSERQKLMADQIKIRRRQRKDSIMNLQRDQLTSTINAAAALSGQMNFGLGGLGSLLYSQLKQQVPQSLLTSPTSSDGSSYSPSGLNPFGSSPDLLRGSLLFPPQSPATSSPPDSASFATNAAVAASLIAAPVAINPVTSTAFPFPLVTNESLLSLLANYKLLEQNPTEISSSESMDTQINSIIDVCNV
ncbi:unnamed protein product [Cylicocyclus nassatus]|uniref:Uncharacterized protein n=1 Tax=Cylicocyclus nassatus TaxID=53992 RepID=A0AA36GET2_CYLNA|nr:unnamed protein product [Cylicocyclus nassatus]